MSRAGPIGCELAQSFQRFGSRVPLIPHGLKILPREDAGGVVRRQLEREGVRVLDHTEPAGAQWRDGDKTLWVSREGKKEALGFEALLIAIGRQPNVEGLAPETAGVEFSARGIEVNGRLRTTNPRIYAAGDICSRFKFTHAAHAMARIVLANALFFGRRKASLLAIPWCTFTDPEVAHVGYYESEAGHLGFDVVTLTEQLVHVAERFWMGKIRDLPAFISTGKKVSSSAGPRSPGTRGEMIGELTLAMATGQRVGAMAATIHPYPTQAEVLKRLGDQYMRQRSIPGLKSLFAKWFAWRR